MNFSEDITVTGTPQLELNVGDGYLSFDGVDDYVDAGSVSNNFSNEDFTINAWVKTSAEGQGILIKNDGDGSWESVGAATNDTTFETPIIDQKAFFRVVQPE